jgi:hypothetical protein
MLKKISAGLLRSEPRYADLRVLFLSHAPRSMADRHYAAPDPALFTSAGGNATNQPMLM